MSNLFQRTSSNWARYDKYEWKEDKEGTLYITPSPDAKVSLYNPLKDSEQMVLKAVNLGLMCMDKNNTTIMKHAGFFEKHIINSISKFTIFSDFFSEMPYIYRMNLNNFCTTWISVPYHSDYPLS